MLERVRTEEKVLTDDSKVFNVILDGEYDTGVGSTRLRLVCVDEKTADAVVLFIRDLMTADRIIGME